jgi:aminopeptidase N
MLRTTFGNEKTDGFLRNLATQLQGREITTYDIQRVAEKSFGGNMSWFFDQWIRGVGIPQYTFEYTVRRAEDNSYLVQGTVSQKVVMGKEDFVAPDLYYKAVGYVTVTGAKSHVETTIGPFLIEGPETKSIIFKFAEEPLQVEFNKYGEILAKDVIVKK